MTGSDSSMIPFMAEIVASTPLSADTSLFRLRLDQGTADYLPGQFFQLSVPAGGEFPVSPASAADGGGELEFCVRRVGQVTSHLHSLGPGGRVGLRGPFGNGFPVAEMAGAQILLLAGGLGIAPLRSLLHYILREPERYASVTLMYGAREPAAMLFRDELVALARQERFRLLLTVDFVRDEPVDGRVCTVGLLPALLRGVKVEPAATWAAICGPPPLYACLVAELASLGFADERIFISLERRMKCGVGHCCHCALGQLLCCSDGPVFRYSAIKGITGAI